MSEHEAQQQPLSGVMDQGMMLTVEFGRFGNRRKASLNRVTVNSDKTLLSLSKKLLKSPEYDAINAFDRETRQWLETEAVPFPIHLGSYLIPDQILSEVCTKLEARAIKRKELVEAFVAVYPVKVAEMASELRDMYAATDYPSADDVEKKFTFEYKFMDYGRVPDRLQRLNLTAYLAEKEKMQAKFAEATVEMQQVFRAEMLGMVDHMVDRLTPDLDGKKKTFKEATVVGLKQFLDSFDTRNLTNDTELKVLVDQARGLLDGVDPAQIRDEEGLRAALQTGFTQIQTAMDGMVETHRRKIMKRKTAAVETSSFEAITADEGDDDAQEADDEPADLDDDIDDGDDAEDLESRL